MSLFRMAASALLLAAPLLGHAQTATPDAAAPAAAPRFYVGLAAYRSSYQYLRGQGKGDTGFPIPVQLTAGYQLRPRLALELGVAYSGNTARSAYGGFYSDGMGNAYNRQHARTNTERVISISALARYTLTRQPAHRLQVDALGGFGLVRSSFHTRGFDASDLSGTLETTSFDEQAVRNHLLLTAGLGLRYRLTPRFELNLDLTTNRNLTSSASFYDGFTPSTALGVRYRFGK